jgi:plastocyanin
MIFRRFKAPLEALGLSLLFAGPLYVAPAAADSVIKIDMKEFMFAPATINVAAGTEVSWLNADDEPHTVVSDTGLFRSGAIDTNERFSFKFTAPGTYHYTCSIHPRMVGTIVVK